MFYIQPAVHKCKSLQLSINRNYVIASTITKDVYIVSYRISFTRINGGSISNVTENTSDNYQEMSKWKSRI